MAGETILVVDDGKDNRDFIVEYVLKPHGYQHLLAADGREGYEMALRAHPDLILLDYQMPRMNGLQVIEALARQQVEIPIILMTFHGSEEIAIEVFRMGVKDYVKKPYYADEMAASIDKALAETRLRREKEALTERVLAANRELQRRLKELNTIYGVGKSVTSIIEMEKLLPYIVDAALHVTGAEEGQLCLIEERRLVRRAYRNQTMTGAQAIEEAIRDPIAIQVIRNRKAAILSGAQLTELESSKRPISAAYAPLYYHGQSLGILSVANFTPQAQPFVNNDALLLSALSDYAAIAIQNSRSYSVLSDSKAKLRDTFERFVPPQVVERAVSQPSEIRPGGQRQEISVLFADIRGYTTWSESVTPETVIETLNQYLSLAAEVIISWEGTLDKFMGDGLMALFNAPNPQPDHVHRVADAALALMKAAREVSTQYGYQLAYSIGVHVGEAVVGYVGTDRALNYTALGDTVNLAKRLQEYAAPGQILVDEEVVKRLGKRVQARALGELKVKGRKTPAFAYELIDLIALD